MTKLAMTVLLWMVKLQDPNGWGVTPEWAASYPATAQEIADAAEANPIGHDPRYTAALLTYTAHQESRFDPNPCARQKKYDCDHGASLGRFQTWRGWGEPTAETSLRVMHKSFEICEKSPFADRLAWYLAGRDCEQRAEMSRHRMHQAKLLADSVDRP
jgi:hypothetical protein